jgi:hypothetical protein
VAGRPETGFVAAGDDRLAGARARARVFAACLAPSMAREPQLSSQETAVLSPGQAARARQRGAMRRRFLDSRSLPEALLYLRASSFARSCRSPSSRNLPASLLLFAHHPLRCSCLVAFVPAGVRLRWPNASALRGSTGLAGAEGGGGGATGLGWRGLGREGCQDVFEVGRGEATE